MDRNKNNAVSIIYVGNLGYISPNVTSVVGNDMEYVSACYTIDLYWRNEDDLEVWVHTKTHFNWLKEFVKRIGIPFHQEEKTARTLLADQWNVIIPDWLTDGEVLEHNLLEMEVDGKEKTTFESRCLSLFVGDAFLQNEIGTRNLASVIKVFLDNKSATAFNKYPFLKRCLKAKCDQWIYKSNENWLKEVCERLYENPEELLNCLSLWAGLHTYPDQLLEFVMPFEQVQFVRKVPPEAVSALPIEPEASSQILNQIEVLFKDIHQDINSGEEFRKVAGFTSGRFPLEFNWLNDILRSKQFKPATEDIEAVRSKFRNCPGVTDIQLKALDEIVEPERPALLDHDSEWSSEEWIRWVIAEYIPYRKWQVSNEYFDEELEKTVARFSDWYISNYEIIHANTDISMIYSLAALFPDGPDTSLTLILLVDCLPITFWDILDEAFQATGLYRHDFGCRFACLPSITENNKSLILGGDFQENTNDYENIIKKRAKSEWDIDHILYAGSLKSFSKLHVPEDSAIIVLNFLEGDELLHSDVESKNTTYEAELYRIFNRLAQAVSQMAEEWKGSKDHFRVCVVTDHGACRILEQEKRSFDSSVVKKLFPDEKYRFSSVSKKQAGEIPEHLWALGHRFTQPFVTEDIIYFLPRGHNTVRHAGAVKGFMHGGATPEEVVVPVSVYKLAKAEWKSLHLRFVNLEMDKESKKARFYIKRVVPLKIEIQNPNPVDVHIIHAAVIFPDTEVKSWKPITVSAEKSDIFEINCYFKKSALRENMLQIEISYEIAGIKQSVVKTLECDFKSAMKGGFNLRDL